MKKIISHLQKKHVNLVIERGNPSPPPSWIDADRLFDHEYQWENLHQLTSQIGISTGPHRSGNLYLPEAIIPKQLQDLETMMLAQQPIKESSANTPQGNLAEDTGLKSQIRQVAESQGNPFFLGLPDVQDETIQYNPNPFELFVRVFEEIWHTLKALVTGSLNPKWMSGPIDIVQVVHHHSLLSIKESLFWLGAISLNLGILNLLPLPVLDGGTICFACYELVTGRRLKAKTLERFIIPFALLLIGLFIFLTYHDLLRLFTG